MTSQSARRPRIGVPWTSTAAQKAGKRRAYSHYLRAVEQAGGEPVEISLFRSSAELREIAQSLDGYVLPGSAADVDPRRFGAKRHAKTADPDRLREHTDDVLLDAAIGARKPVLAICYGAQILNVHQHGTLVQDVPTEIRAPVAHEPSGRGWETRHPIRFTASGRVSELAGNGAIRVNTSHHQSIGRPGQNLRVVATAPDGVVEAVEWVGPEWIVGVQWHPERMTPLDASGSNHRPGTGNGDGNDGVALASALFSRLVSEASRGR